MARAAVLSSAILGGALAGILTGCDDDTPNASEGVDPAVVPATATSAAGPGATTSAQGPSGMRSPFAPSPEPKAELMPALDAMAVGDVNKATDYQMTVLQVELCQVETYFAPSPGNIKLGVEVEVEGLTEREVPVNPFHATVRDEEDNEYTATLAGCTPALRSQRIKKDETAKGFVTFELPANAANLVMTYTPFIIGSTEQRLKFALGR